MVRRKNLVVFLFLMLLAIAIIVNDWYLPWASAIGIMLVCSISDFYFEFRSRKIRAGITFQLGNHYFRWELRK